jgi:hypothetical protein
MLPFISSGGTTKAEKKNFCKKVAKRIKDSTFQNWKKLHKLGINLQESYRF